MAATDPSKRQADVDHVSAVTRAAADDMAAIFGPGARTAAGASLPPRITNIHSARPRKLIFALLAGALAATIAGGIYAGNSTIGAGPEAPRSIVASHTLRTAERPPIGLVPTGPTVPINAAISSSPSPALAAVSAATSGRDVVSVPADPPLSTQPLALARPPASPADATPAIHHSLPTTARFSGLPVPTAPRRTICDDYDSEACVASHIETAEQRLADAYQQAVSAGVRERVLRGYRHEWDRARDETAEQPRDALRLYAMMTSDLYGLAQDADADDGESFR